MTTRFEDILSLLCRRVTSGPSSDFQQVFVLEDSKEAHLAFDLLVTYGFEAKVYDEPSGTKLYITVPAEDAAEEKFAAVLAYAKALKAIKLGCDELRNQQAAGAPDYTMAFANTHDDGKQLLIHFLPPAQAKETPVAAPSAPMPAMPKAQPRKGLAKKFPHLHHHEHHFETGPAIAKRAAKGQKKSSNHEGIFKEFQHYLTGHMGAVIVISIALIAIFITLFSVFTVGKGFMCPDLATVKSHAWYCPHTDENEKSQP